MFKLLILFLFMPICSNAFINIESLRENTKDGLNTSLKFLFNQQTGNTDRIVGSASSLNSYENSKNEYLLIADIQYGESFEQKDTDNGSLHLRYTRELTAAHYAELYTQYEYNRFVALNSRKLYGAGYRLKLQYFNLGIGAFNEREEILDRSNQNANRGNIYLSSSIKNKTGLEFSSIIYYQPSFKRSNDTRVILNAGLSQSISKYISFIVEYEYAYDELPPEEINPKDTYLQFGFNLVF